MQCFRCQKIGDHLAGSCKEEQKCVLCSGPHRKADCTATKDNYKCANCKGSHAAWSHECPWLQKAIDAKKTPTVAQVASATITPAVLQQVIQEVKESIVMLVSEVVSRSICELVYDIHDKKVSKLALPLKVATIATHATHAANKLNFGPATLPVAKDAVKDKLMDTCFPKRPPTNADAQINSQKGTAHPAS